MRTYKSPFWKILDFLFEWYYKAKRYILKPKMEMLGDLMPCGHSQAMLLRAAYNHLLSQGYTKRNARRIIERKFRIKVIPQQPSIPAK
jgi:hypothetical protein